MGAIYAKDDYHIQCHIEGLNLRFAPGDPIEEMAHLQKEFGVFSKQHTLQDSIALLNVTNDSWELRKKWFKLLKWIAEIDSNHQKMKGGEAITDVLKSNLESPTKSLLPVYFRTHDYEKKPQVLINRRGEQAIFYIDKLYLVISLPLLKARPRKKSL